MIVNVFNSGVVSGPEMLVLPALKLFHEPQAVVFLVETRLGEKGKEPAAFARSLGIRTEIVEVHSRLDVSAIGRLRGVLRWLAPSVVHAHDVKATTYAWLASNGEAWKRVSTHHGVQGRPDGRTRAYELFYSHVVLPRMHMAIAVSREDEFELLRRGLNPQHLVLVSNGITRPRLEGETREMERTRRRAELEKEIGPFGDAFLVGMLARLSAEKRHSYFLRVLAELAKARPELPWRFLSFGSGSLDLELRRETERLGLGERVHWLGYRPNAADFLPALDLLAFPSFAEGLPIAALEAGWAGVPLFATNVGALPELVSTGKQAGGVIFPREQEHAHTARSLAWLLEHPLERERLGARLQNRVAREYSAEAWVRRTEDVYRSI